MRYYLYVLVCLTGLFTLACKGAKKEVKEDILVGELHVSVDESVLPLLLEQQEVFEESYSNAKIVFEGNHEVGAINDLLARKTSFAILARPLNEKEGELFEQLSITPRLYPLAYDGIIFVGNIAGDSTISIPEVLGLLEGNKTRDFSLVFDNLNSSAFRYFRDMDKSMKLANTYVQAVGSATKVLEFVAQNKNEVGVIGYSQYLSLKRTFPEMDKIRILSVLNDSLETPRFVAPSQASLSTDEYPLKRTVYVMNYQPNLGLGIGFSSFLTGDRGQRIVLKYGILPATMPGREIIIRDRLN